MENITPVLGFVFGENLKTSSADNSSSAESKWIPDFGLHRETHGRVNEQLRKRLLITRDSSICEGEPILCGTRISVVNIIEKRNYLGWDEDRILEDYPHLSRDHIRACVEYYEERKAEIDDLIEEERGVDDRVA